MSSLDYLELCRLCLVKDRVSVPIFEGEGDVRQIFLKIAACLPVKVAREDKLPKKICDDCVYKVELFYQFWNTTANAEKQLLQWLGEVGLEDKQGYVTNVLNPSVMKQEQSTENRLDGSVMQPVGEHQNNMGMGMMDNMGLGIPMIISSTNQEEMTSVPMDTGGSSVQTVQAVPGPSAQPGHNQISQNQTNPGQQDEEEESSEEEDNSDEECDGDEGLPVKEEGDEDPNGNRTIEPTTFVNVSLACDDVPGPSGLQQQKIADMPEMAIAQPAEGDPKSGKSSIAEKDDTVNPSKERVVIIYHGLRKKSKTKPRKDERRTSVKPDAGVLKSSFERNNKKEEVDEILDKLRNTCPICEKRFKDEKQVEKHVRGVHSAPEVPLIRDDAKEEEVDQVLDKLRDTCPFCEKRFKDERQMEKHVRAIHKRPFKCDKCRRSYFTSWALDEHRKTHSNDFYFECSVCHLKYKRKEGLKHHQMRVHSDLDPKFMCDHCGKRFKLKLDLLLHIGRAHMNNIQICRFCGKAVKDLTHHEWRHEKVLRKVSFEFHCHLCSKKFRTNNKLDNHLLLHKEGFKCEQCNEVLRGPSQLVRHRQTKHKPGMLCTICEKVFQCRSNFYQHVLTHAGVRPYKCDVCGEDFTQRSSLLRHRRNHPGPLPPLITSTRIADVARNILQKHLTMQRSAD